MADRPPPARRLRGSVVAVDSPAPLPAARVSVLSVNVNLSEVCRVRARSAPCPLVVVLR